MIKEQNKMFPKHGESIQAQRTQSEGGNQTTDPGGKEGKCAKH